MTLVGLQIVGVTRNYTQPGEMSVGNADTIIKKLPWENYKMTWQKEVLHSVGWDSELRNLV